jgi:hypothetical protein
MAVSDRAPRKVGGSCLIALIIFLLVLGYAPTHIIAAFITAFAIDYYICSRIGARIARGNS